MLELKGNPNYAAFIYEVAQTHPLDGLDNLVGVNVGGYQALVPKTTKPGDRFVAVVAGTQISASYTMLLNLHRDSSLNADKNQTGYLENNRRVKAIRLRGNASNALLLDINLFDVDLSGERVGTEFDHINGVEFSRKFVVPANGNTNNGSTVAKKHKSGVTSEQFPEHYDTPQWHRVSQDFAGKDVTVTQKCHGTSLRAGWVEIDRPAKWYERLLIKAGVPVSLKEWKFVVGSRRVIKTEGDGNHWYSTDIWSEYAQTHNLAEALPKGVMIYGELIGWLPDGTPIQRGYTYNLPKGQAALYIYRVTVAGADGTHYDLSDAAMREVAAQRGLKVVPLLASFGDGPNLALGWLEEFLEEVTDKNLFRDYPRPNLSMGIKRGAFIETPVPLSPDSPCDEGVVIRAEGITPKATKFKFPRFYEHESRAMDKGEVDIEDAAS